MRSASQFYLTDILLVKTDFNEQKKLLEEEERKVESAQAKVDKLQVGCALSVSPILADVCR